MINCVKLWVACKILDKLVINFIHLVCGRVVDNFSKIYDKYDGFLAEIVGELCKILDKSMTKFSKFLCTSHKNSA